MEPVTISRRNQPSKKGNKENTMPPTGVKSFIKTGTSVVPFQPRGNKKEDALNNDSLKGKSKPMDRKAASAVVPNKGQTLRPTVAEASKQTVKSALGMYKGRIVQSKIGSIWKSSDTLNAAEPKPENEKVRDTARKNRSKSVTEAPRQVPNRPVPMRSKSVSDKPHQVTRPAAATLRPAGFCSTRPPTRTIAAVASTKPGGNQNPKPKVPVTEKKACKPGVSSTLSQYRTTMETAEEKRAKLAEWLASKGKTLKRPAMTTIVPTKAKLPTKVKEDPKAPGDLELQLATRCKDEPDPSLKTHDQALEIKASSVEAQREEIRAATPGIMNTTLDLLDDSDSTEPQGRVDDIVVNLCDALEAMVTPSRCSDDAEVGCDQSGGRGSEQIQAEQSKEAEITDLKVKQEDDDDVMETTPPADASMIKYSVKTTPYLQSVKKTIEGEVSMSTSRRKGNIKDLKFLTPVRRSNRIQRISSHLPSMLTDHDPCVSSLAELVKLDEDPNAYIYRKNPALLQELPDQN